jgi:hypothetical protein
MLQRLRFRAHTLLTLSFAAAFVGCAGIVGIGDLPGTDGNGGETSSGTRPGGGSSSGGSSNVQQTGTSGFDASTPGFDAPGPGSDGSSSGSDATAPTGDAGGLGYFASNLGAMTFDPSVTGPLTLSGDNCQIFTEVDPPGLSCDSGQNPPNDYFMVDLGGGAGTAIVWVFTYISIDDQSQLTVGGSLPLILVSLASVDIAGQVDASADRYDPDVPAIPGARLNGPGLGGYSNGGPQGGGGGSFCGLGGTGAMGSGAIAKDSAPGTAYGSADLIPLWGGSPGGGANTGDADQANGNGGGVLQISAAKSITLDSAGYITVNGSGGVSPGDESGEGGGSGGGILLEAPTVTIRGILEANGGEGSDPNSDGADPPDDAGVAVEPGCAGGQGSAGHQINGGNGNSTSGAGGESAGFGGGGGGAGRIRINATTFTMPGGTISPSVGTSCFSQGALP